MDGLIEGPRKANRPAFCFEGSPELTAFPPPSGQLALSGPSVKMEPGHLPVRGDLAHIKLAGQCFVPHYAVPMPHKVIAPIQLRAAQRLDADEVCEVPAGSTFNVLDIAGGWAWGQCGDDGFVGYVPMSNLEAI